MNRTALAAHAALLAALLASPARTQSTARAPAKADGEQGSYPVHSEALSRRLFTACDPDRDDKILFLEARRCLDAVRTPKDFQQIDRNRDGVVRFDEFDAWFLGLTRSGASLVVAAEVVARAELAGKVAPGRDATLARFFALIDVDQSDRIEPTEWARIAPLLGDDREVRFEVLDADLSGDLTPDELAPLTGRLEVLARPPKDRSLRPLPESTAGMDVDGDGRLDTAELARALARIHPALLRHTATVLRAADRNGDGRLDGVELREAIERGPAAATPRPLRLR
ncbi:MAG: hypothetical protein R3F30_10545 [Planctomycetota bacterium]